MNGPEELLKTESQWVTRMGAWFPGERVVFRGQDLHVDLRDMGWMELYLYGITGRRFSEPQLKLLNAIWTYTSFPEPRLWNNRVAALAGTARSTATLAISAAVAVSEASIYGHKPSVRAIDFFKRTRQAVDGGEDLLDCIKEELRLRRMIAGYGRPLFREDERIPHLMRLTREVGMDRDPFITLALEIERLLLEGRWRMRLNIGGFGAALAADMGFSPQEFHLFKIPCFLAGMPPCFIDTETRAEGAFFPFRCSRIRYEGVGRRKWEADDSG